MPDRIPTVALPTVDIGPPPPVTRLELELTEPLPLGLIVSDQASAELELPIDVPAGPWGGADALRLTGLLARATLELDGVAVGKVEPGVGSGLVDLSGRLTPGPHTLRLSFSFSDLPTPMILGGDGHANLGLVDPPVLLLRPAAHVEDLAVDLRDGAVTATAEVRGAPEGATVRFYVTRDGLGVAALGEAEVTDGRATTQAVPWTLPEWSVGAPELYTVFGVLYAPDQVLLDAYGVRTAPRRVGLTQDGFQVGAYAGPLVAMRNMPTRGQDEGLRALAWTGANALEFHGVPPTTEQLESYDEIGVAVALTPRCEGAFQVVPQAERAAIVDSNAAVVAAQSRSHAWQMAAHPAMALWVAESRELAALAGAMGDADPQRRPVVHGDPAFETVVLGGGRDDVPVYKGSWIGETLWNGKMGSVEDATAAFAAALAAGARGGVIEHVLEPDRLSAWVPVLAAEGIAPLRIDGRRADGVVVVHDAPAGGVAWLEGPWLPARGKVSMGGELRLSAWYEGQAELVLGTRRSEVAITPRVWTSDGARGDVTSAPSW